MTDSSAQTNNNRFGTESNCRDLKAAVMKKKHVYRCCQANGNFRIGLNVFASNAISSSVSL